MKFLLTNDDGIEGPGISVLREVVEKLGEWTIAAPHQALSGCSHRVTTDEPIHVRALSKGRYLIQGTPADCVRLGVLRFATDADWIVSGINDGGNLGVDVFMSGTVGAAREAALLGRKAVAISQYRRRKLPFEWSWAGALAEHSLRQLFRRPLPPRCFWNVNLPADYAGTGDLPDLVFCPPEPHPLPVTYEEIDGAFHYRSDYHKRQRRAGSDVDVCFSGRISVSLIAVEPC